MATTDQSALLIYTTFAATGDAEKLGEKLVEAGLAACVNIYPGMISIYRWEDKLERAGEVGMIVKTVRARAAEAVEMIEREHPYDTPAVLTLPVEGGSEAYLAWIAAEAGGGTR